MLCTNIIAVKIAPIGDTNTEEQKNEYYIFKHTGNMLKNQIMIKQFYIEITFMATTWKNRAEKNNFRIIVIKALVSRI